jgi:hypothetical protein
LSISRLRNRAAVLLISPASRKPNVVIREASVAFPKPVAGGDGRTF